jgi:hypothetical protein
MLLQPQVTPDDYQEQRTLHCCKCLNPTPYIVANAAVYGSAAHGHKVQEPEHSTASTCVAVQQPPEL